MENGDIKVSNKIITSDDLIEIFNKMNEDLEKYLKTFKNEELMNKTLEYGYQKWTFKDNGSKLTFSVEYNDNTEIKYENYINFVTAFKNRIEEIKHIYVHYNLYYDTRNEEKKVNEFHHKNITMYIYTDKIEMHFEQDVNDEKIKDIYNFIKDKIDRAPTKYEEIIKEKSKITLTVGASIGFIVATAICVILLIFPTMRTLYAQSFVLYPILCLFLTFVIGEVIGINMLDGLYKNIVPEKKYESSVKDYRDDINKYTEKSEVLIGKNYNNLEKRTKIKEQYNECKKYIKYEAIALVVISILVIIIGM